MASLLEPPMPSSPALPLQKIAVFIGGTSWIGRATLTQFVNQGSPLKAYIVGRNEEEFRPVLCYLRASNKTAELIFLEGQVSLMAETKRLTDEILRREEHIDLFCLSADFLDAKGRELATAVGYYSRQIFIQGLLPLLRAAFNTGTGQYSPRLVNVLGTGFETTDLYLDNLELKEPGHSSVQSYAHHSATMTSISLKRLAERPENSEITFIHHHPGLFSTEIFQKCWGNQWSEDKAAGGPNAPSDITRCSPEEVGERSMYVMTSSQYGGNGIALTEGQKKGLTVNGTTKGSLFCVGDKLEILQLDGLLGKLEGNGASAIIWNKTNELIGNYL
ncbi:hypothetical protein N7481_009341 [Penicillium waksmanii]|uniref:uncharacterized protein n=1 Tax=Penicillium waksmanii TaxID=69791 RepID=UPI002548710D|nr:uncharacterized protein N7481_009341 [Penicillium waksmanii]KAJ5975634.1 hypothetical protein N7481_009341 [Penicillium waksmanii]